MADVDPVKQPYSVTPGSKVENSPHRNWVATALLQRKGYAHIQRYLESENYPIDYSTLRNFEMNFVSKLSQEVREKLLQRAYDEEKSRNAGVINQAVHAHMSRVESTIRLIEESEDMLAQLKFEKQTPYLRRVVGEQLDRIRYFREQLEIARKSSEVELEREKAIQATAEIALEYLKDATNVEQFIQRVAALRDRSVVAAERGRQVSHPTPAPPQVS